MCWCGPYVGVHASYLNQSRYVSNVEISTKLLGLVPHRKLMVGERNIKVGQSWSMRLVFWVKLGQDLDVVGSGEPKPGEVPARVGPDSAAPL
jgi:hypothetical protein